MMFEVLTEQSPRAVGWSLTGVAPGHPCSCMRRKMLTAARTGQAAAHSDWRWETDYPRIAFFWLSRVRTI